MPITTLKSSKIQRPREKLTTVGQSNLTNQELVTLILGSGTQQFPAAKVAQLLLHNVSLPSLAITSLAQLQQIQGIGASQASRVLACVELGRRIFTTSPSLHILSSEQAVKQASNIRHHQREHLLGLYLNARQELVHQETITIGGLNYTNVSPRDVFAAALSLPAAFVILIHNHPSGNPQPSQADFEVTERLMAAGQLLGIEVLDHLVVTKDSYYSFKESGLL